MNRPASPGPAAAVLIIAVAILALCAPARHAAADPSPTAAPRPSTRPAATPPASPAVTPPVTPPTDIYVPGAPAPDKPAGNGAKGILGPLNVTGPQGVRLDHYDITYSTGGLFGSESPSAILGWLTDGLFSLVRIIIGACVCLLRWAYAFGPARDGLKPARDLSLTYQHQVIDRLGLGAFFMTLAAAWCGFMWLRGRKGRSVAELGISLLIAALAATVLARPADLLLGEHGLLGQTRDTSMALASITATAGKSDSTDPRQAAKPLGDTLITTFVIQPHQMINYGRILNDPEHPDKCAAAYNKIVHDGPWGTKDDPRERLNAAGCKDLADYNTHPSWDKLLGALLVLVAAILVAVLIVLMVGILLTAIAALAFYAMAAQAALVIAVLPGGGRGVLWRWCGGIIKVVLVVFAVVIFIPLLSVFLGVILKNSSHLLVVKFFLVDVVAAAGLMYHRKLVTFGTRAGYRIARRLEMARYGGSRGSGEGMGGYGGYGGYGYGHGMGMGWLGAGNPSGLSPVTASGLLHGARAEIHRVTDPVSRGAHHAKRTWVGSPAAAAKATSRLRSDGVDADSLRARMAKTRGGRVIYRTGKLVQGAGKAGFEYTLGLPVTLERDWQTKVKPGAEKTKQAYGSTRNAAADTVDAARQYGRHWTRNVRWAGGKAGGDALAEKIEAARLKASFDPAAARRTLAERAGTGKATTTSEPRPVLPPGKDDVKATTSALVKDAAKKTAGGAAAGAVKGGFKGFVTGGTTGAKAGASRGAIEGAGKAAHKNADPQKFAEALRRSMEQRRRRPPPDAT